jgi:hypothetical protein
MRAISRPMDGSSTARVESRDEGTHSLLMKSAGLRASERLAAAE